MAISVSSEWKNGRQASPTSDRERAETGKTRESTAMVVTGWKFVRTTESRRMQMFFI